MEGEVFYPGGHIVAASFARYHELFPFLYSEVHHGCQSTRKKSVKVCNIEHKMEKSLCYV